MPKRQSKKPTTGNRNDVRRNGKAWKGGKAPNERKPGDKGYSGPVAKKPKTRVKMDKPKPNTQVIAEFDIVMPKTLVDVDAQGDVL